MSTIRASIRKLVELGAVASGAEALSRRLRARHVAILAYHNVVPDDDAGHGESSLHLPYSRFLAQIDRLQRTHDIVDLDTAIEPAMGRRPRAVLTFDDAYHGAVSLALPELSRRGVPATVFVAPGILGERSMWWDELAHDGQLDDVVRAHAMHALTGRNERVRADMRDARLLPASYRIASESELAAACSDRISVGAHSWSHACLPALESTDLRSELDRSLAWVRSWRGASTRWLALPYGEGHEGVTAMAREAGFDGVLGIRGGRWRGVRASELPRINVPAGMSTRGVALRTSGMFD